MVHGIITVSVPEKINTSFIYEKIKTTEAIVVVEKKLLIKDEDGTWPSISDEEAKLRIRSLFLRKEWQTVLDDGLMGGIVKSLKNDPDLQRSASDFKHDSFLKVKDGVWDIPRCCILENPGQLLFNRALDVKLTSELPPESKVFSKFCESIFDETMVAAKKQALYEIIGYCISDMNAVKMAIFLIGPANCGKSVILKFLQKLVGEEYVSNVPLAGFSQRFSIAEMHEKVLNINGEVPSGALPGRALDVFKGITGGDRMQLERKGCHPFSAVVNTKLIFAGNTLPVFSKVDGTDALIERLHILLFDKEVPEKERNCHLLDELWEDRHTIVRHALVALKEFDENEKIFKRLSDEEKILESLKHVANPIVHFIESRTRKGEDKEVHITDVYEAYKKFAAAEALQELDRMTFRNLMTTQPGITVGKTKKRLGKKSPQVCFVGLELINEEDINEKDMNESDTDQVTRW